MSKPGKGSVTQVSVSYHKDGDHIEIVRIPIWVALLRWAWEHVDFGTSLVANEIWKKTDKFEDRYQVPIVSEEMGENFVHWAWGEEGEYRFFSRPTEDEKETKHQAEMGYALHSLISSWDQSVWPPTEVMREMLLEVLKEYKKS